MERLRAELAEVKRPRLNIYLVDESVIAARNSTDARRTPADAPAALADGAVTRLACGSSWGWQRDPRDLRPAQRPPCGTSARCSTPRRWGMTWSSTRRVTARGLRAGDGPRAWWGARRRDARSRMARDACSHGPQG